MTRSLFIYWKTGREDAASAAADLAVWQQDLCRLHPDLVATLYRRADESDPAVTLMETYSCRSGIDAALQAEIVAGGAAASACWCQGERQVEIFEVWRDGDPGPQAAAIDAVTGCAAFPGAAHRRP
ncbi:MAG TPA: DUF4936 family protein [Rubrivivax sp.]|nr:DUF4936 family protein [Rubrivivax sp.]